MTILLDKLKRHYILSIMTTTAERHLAEGRKSAAHTVSMWVSVQKHLKALAELSDVSEGLTVTGWEETYPGTWSRGPQELTLHPSGDRVRVVVPGAFTHTLQRSAVMPTLKALLPT